VPESDEHLIARIRAGESGAFDELARAHARDIFLLARGLLGNAEDAQDAAQEVLIALHRHLSRLRDPRALPAWLSRVCVRRCRAILRRRRQHQPLTNRELRSDPQMEPEQRVVARDTQRAVREALLRLPRRQQTVFVLRYFAGRSTAQIAASLNCAPATVRVHLARAVARLRDALAEGE
jgi:RNA polymerase sigma factor (sigma-70 family)